MQTNFATLQDREPWKQTQGKSRNWMQIQIQSGDQTSEIHLNEGRILLGFPQGESRQRHCIVTRQIQGIPVPRTKISSVSLSASITSDRQLLSSNNNSFATRKRITNMNTGWIYSLSHFYSLGWQCIELNRPTLRYSWMVFIPRIWWPMWLSMLPALTTRIQAGSFISSLICAPHFRSSLRSQFVPNLMVRLLGFPVSGSFFCSIWERKQSFKSIIEVNESRRIKQPDGWYSPQLPSICGILN